MGLEEGLSQERELNQVETDPDIPEDQEAGDGQEHGSLEHVQRHSQHGQTFGGVQQVHPRELPEDGQPVQPDRLFGIGRQGLHL